MAISEGPISDGPISEGPADVAVTGLRFGVATLIPAGFGVASLED